MERRESQLMASWQGEVTLRTGRQCRSKLAFWLGIEKRCGETRLSDLRSAWKSGQCGETAEAENGRSRRYEVRNWATADAS